MYKEIIIVFITIVSVFTVFPTNVYAYIDPGSGSYIVQMIIAGVLGGGFMLRSAIINFFKKIFNQDDKKSKQKEDNS